MSRLGTEGNGRMRLVSPATITGAVQFDMRAVNGRTYRIYIHEPIQEPPPGGYPVLYVTDGNALFGTAAMQAEMMELNALIVGIGYATADRMEPDILRLRDLTWVAPSAETATNYEAWLQSKSISYGGAEEYFRFIKEEVEPAVASAYEIDRANRAIFGHSLGGLFALYLLFKYPGEFTTYVAGSPSIWWSDEAILREVSSFRRLIESQQVSPRVLVTVGSLEGSTEGLRTPKGMDREQFDQTVRRARMVGNARELAAQLELIHRSEGYEVEYQELDGETHGSVVAATISRALRFSLRSAP